jgi:hypothetical protein
MFRRLRRTRVSEGRVGGYLLYAAGETTLIVIGILIALQVNTWNEARKLGHVEDQLLAGFLRDLAQDTLVLSHGIDGTGIIFERRRALLERTRYDDVPFDSLTQLAAQIWSVGDLTLTRATFTKLQSYRDGYPISDPELLDRILRYYTRELDEHQALLDWDDADTDEASGKLWYREEWEVIPLGWHLGPEHAFPKLLPEEASARALRSFLRTAEARNIYRLDYWRKYHIHEHFRQKKDDVIVLMDAIRAFRDG